MAETSIVKRRAGRGGWPAGMAVLLCGAAAVCALAGVTGCGNEKALIQVTAGTLEPHQDMAGTIGLIETNASRWVSLEAECNVVIRDLLGHVADTDEPSGHELLARDGLLRFGDDPWEVLKRADLECHSEGFVGFELTVLVAGLSTAFFLIARSRLWPS